MLENPSQLYDLLCCPKDQSSLTTILLDDKSANGHDQGALLCPSCKTLWSICDGIPRFVNEGNVDHDIDIEMIRKAAGESPDITDEVIERNISRLETWRDGDGGGWERDEMLFWENYYAEKLERGDKEWAVTYNRLIPRQKYLLSKLPRTISRVLEIGCGTSGTLWVDKKFMDDKTYFGTDLSFNALKVSRSRMNGHHVLCDVNALPFRQGAMDAILGFGVLHHLPNHEQAIETLSGILDPGGWLGFAEKLKTCEKMQKSTLVAYAKKRVMRQDRNHGSEEYVDGKNLIRLLDKICTNHYSCHYDYSVVRDVLDIISIHTLRLNSPTLTRINIFMDNLVVKTLAPVHYLFQPKQVTFVAQKQ